MRPATARLARSAAVGVAGAALAASAHVVAGGAAPGLATLTAAGLVLAAGALIASRGPLGTARLLVLLLGAQAVLHATFELAAPSAGGHAHHGGEAAGVLTPAGEATMVGAHVLATLALALLLARGEAWLFGAGRAAVRLVRRLTAPAARRADHVAPAVRSWAGGVVPPPSLRPLAGAASRRGPPRVALRRS
jgi:hypothetical protein